jgi:predicted dehydrogenase
MESIKISLVIGMNIGQLYKNVLIELGSTVYTVDTDPEKKADFLSVDDAIRKLITRGVNPQQIDTVHICTPNWTHEAIARQVGHYANIVFIEKPGLQTEERLNKLHTLFPDTRFMMVKNNMWRNNIRDMQEIALTAKGIHLNWINFDRVPNPGTWFTTKELSYGGVSRDLMPHLLSLVAAIFPNTYKTLDLTGNGKTREWSLYDLVETEYGSVNPNGVYNVDDLAWLDFTMYAPNGIPERYIRLEADWRTMEDEARNVVFDIDNESVTHDLGLCPEYAYRNMIQECFDNLGNHEFWDNQYEIDLWIHRMVNEI